MNAQQPLANDRPDEFVRLLTEHDRDVQLFILSLVPNWADAEEIHQETNIKLWQEFSKYQLGSDFGKWARTIARYEVLTFRTREQRDCLRISQRSVDLVAADAETAIDKARPRQIVMLECIKELDTFNRELIRLYYTAGRKIREIAREFHCTTDAAYKALQRTRDELRRCVDRKLGEGEKS